jgi:hypothetical protein
VITLTFECGGCFAKAQGTTWLKREFVSVSGRSHGIGSYRYDTPEDVAPEGWIAFDPYTGCTYCPKCWSEIVTPPSPSP